MVWALSAYCPFLRELPCEFWEVGSESAKLRKYDAEVPLGLESDDERKLLKQVV